MASNIMVHLRLPSGNLLFSGTFPEDTPLSAIEEADLGAVHDKRFSNLRVVSVAGQALPTDGPGEWAVHSNTDADAGRNAAEMAAGSEADLESCKQKCITEGFGGFAVWQGTAYFRDAVASDLSIRAASANDATLHLHFSGRELALRRSLADRTSERSDGGVLELGVVRVARKVDMKLAEVAQLGVPVPEVRDLRVTVAAEDSSLECLAQMFPSLQKLEVVLPQHTKAGAPASFWDPIQHLASLERLHLANHHSFARDGCFGNEVFRSLLGWGERECKLKAFAMTGAMQLSLKAYKSFVDDNAVLSPDLEEFSVYHWFANPPQVDDEVIQKVTRRYRRLRLLEVGSCCHSATDQGFRYLGANDEGVRAGLELEKLFLVCTTSVQGQGWLDPDSVKQHLPKLKTLAVGGGRCFCSCGRGGCGSHAHVFEKLKTECGVSISHSAPHW